MRTRHLVVAAAAAMLALGNALPASAQTTTTTSLTLTQGTLSITVQASAPTLGTRANTAAPMTISGQLGEVQVNDLRSAPLGSGWVASAISTAFTPPTGTAIGAGAVGYTVGPITKTGTATYTANDPPTLSGVAPAVTATAITGDNTATWNPTINVAVPAGLAAGVYAATITHSVV